jgi:hypothetical protein
MGTMSVRVDIKPAVLVGVHVRPFQQGQTKRYSGKGQAASLLKFDYDEYCLGELSQWNCKMDENPN